MLLTPFIKLFKPILQFQTNLLTKSYLDQMLLRPNVTEPKFVKPMFLPVHPCVLSVHPCVLPVHPCVLPVHPCVLPVCVLPVHPCVLSKNVSPFGQAVWPAVANIKKYIFIQICIHEQRAYCKDNQKYILKNLLNINFFISLLNCIILFYL